MHKKTLARPIVALSAAAVLTLPGLASVAQADSNNSAVQQKIEAMQAQIDALQAQLDHLKGEQAGQATREEVTQGQAEAAGADESAAPSSEQQVASSSAGSSEDGITLGGAVRFQYSLEDYDSGGNTDRNGDVDFDIFRLDLHGQKGGVILDAQWRWYQYQNALHHAWVGYDFNDDNQLQIGLTRVPFGNQPFDSHSFFFSSNYYVGLEDSYKMGVEYVYSADPWNVQLAFFKNDGHGGVGHGDGRKDSYTFNILGVGGVDSSGDPLRDAGTTNTTALRVARTFQPVDDLAIELGTSGLYGHLRAFNNANKGSAGDIGDYYAWAVHTDINWRRWNFQLQAGRYAYRTDQDVDMMVVGAYAAFYPIAARANSFNANVAYHLPVSWGPITGLDFYNDFSLIDHKSGGLDRTWMNDTGIGVTAGGLYTYIDWVHARNQPFIGGNMAGDGGVNSRFNVNFGYYF